jgi:putative two-component system response regulator
MLDGAKRAKILVADDEAIDVDAMAEILEPHYTTVVAKDGGQALDRLAQGDLPDLALLDVMMPRVDGFQLAARMKADPKTTNVPIIFVTALDRPLDEARGFAVGAVDFVTKPISAPILLARVRTHLELATARVRLERHTLDLQRLVDERTSEVAATQDVTIRALASLAETRDNETGAHIRRTQHYARLLAQEMRRRAPSDPRLSERSIELIFKSAPLHDIGKVGIPDSILLKPGKLTPEEFEIMKRHAEIGRQALLAAAEESSQPSDFLTCAIEIAGAHHEKWDGGGYPNGLRGETIPLSARLMAVADVFDALTSRRVYKPAMPFDQAAAIIEKGAGSHFDPAVVGAFKACLGGFEAIATAHADRDQREALAACA